MDYNLSDLISSGKDIPLPQIVERLGTQREYRRELRKILMETGAAVNEALLVHYASAYEEEDTISELILLSAVLLALKNSTERAKSAASALLEREAVYLDQKFIASVTRLTGVDLTPLIAREDSRELIELIVKRNLSYITSLQEQTRTRIEQTVIEAQMNNTPPAELKKQLRKVLGKEAKRADLIADDQLEKLAAEIVGFRAEQAGMREYIWRSLMDGRERALHHSLHGKKQNTKNPNHGDHGMLPRQPIRCRCWAQWIISAAVNK